MPSKWRASERATWPRSTCPAVFLRRCSISATALALIPGIRVASRYGRLPFFGGAGNNYSMHAIAETVQRARRDPGTYGLVGANGGIVSKYSAGVYSTTPAPRLPTEVSCKPSRPVLRVLWHDRGPGGLGITQRGVRRRLSPRRGLLLGHRPDRLHGPGRDRAGIRGCLDSEPLPEVF